MHRSEYSKERMSGEPTPAGEEARGSTDGSRPAAGSRDDHGSHQAREESGARAGDAPDAYAGDIASAGEEEDGEELSREDPGTGDTGEAENAAVRDGDDICGDEISGDAVAGDGRRGREEANRVATLVSAAERERCKNASRWNNSLIQRRKSAVREVGDARQDSRLRRNRCCPRADPRRRNAAATAACRSLWALRHVLAADSRTSRVWKDREPRAGRVLQGPGGGAHRLCRGAEEGPAPVPAAALGQPLTVAVTAGAQVRVLEEVGPEYGEEAGSGADERVSASLGANSLVFALRRLSQATTEFGESVEKFGGMVRRCVPASLRLPRSSPHPAAAATWRRATYAPWPSRTRQRRRPFGSAARR